ncbi:MAG TPA: hypothetical protein VEC16_06190 [Alphaproteobacteria bacterium]|nr:hypothetical protein [Alphaproteobacteria bacterium]
MEERKPSSFGRILKYTTLGVVLLGSGFFAGRTYDNMFIKKYLKHINNDQRLDQIEKGPLGISIYIQQPSGFLKSLDAIQEDELEAYRMRQYKSRDSLEQKISAMR